MKLKDSEIIAKFLKYADECEKKYNNAYKEVGVQDKKTCDILHKLELDKLTYRQRCKLMTELKECRVIRRHYKNMTELYAPMVSFLSDNGNRKLVNKLKQVLGEIRKVEQYHKRRVYVPRVIEQKNSF